VTISSVSPRAVPTSIGDREHCASAARRWKIIEHVREKFCCRDCEAITEAPAPSHPIPRGFAGPSLLAMVLVNKFLLHQSLNRQSKTDARGGVEIDVSTLADRVGACVVALEPLDPRHERGADPRRRHHGPLCWRK
jgi:transposase